MTTSGAVQSIFIGALLLAAGACGGHGGRCCPVSPGPPTGCIDLGGFSTSGCFQTCDFFCATNFRTETDTHGCPVIRYDIRAPAPGENQLCLPASDGGGSDAPGG